MIPSLYMAECANRLQTYFEQVWNSLYDTRRVDTLRFKLFHDIQKVIVDLRLIAEFKFHLIQVGERIFHFKPREFFTRRLHRCHILWHSLDLLHLRCLNWLWLRRLLLQRWLDSIYWARWSSFMPLQGVCSAGNGINHMYCCIGLKNDRSQKYWWYKH